jgi:hypothetical protein
MIVEENGDFKRAAHDEICHLDERLENYTSLILVPQ